MLLVAPGCVTWKSENCPKWSGGVLFSRQNPSNLQNHRFRLLFRPKRSKIANLPLFSIVFYSKTIGKQRMLSEWVNPKTSGLENWYIAFSDIVDSNCKRFLETYFVFLNPITRPPTEVVPLTVNSLSIYDYTILQKFTHTYTCLSSLDSFS